MLNILYIKKKRKRLYLKKRKVILDSCFYRIIFIDSLQAVYFVATAADGAMPFFVRGFATWPSLKPFLQGKKKRKEMKPVNKINSYYEHL